MVYLIIGLMCSATISIVFKIGGKKHYNTYAMLIFNYLTCVVAGLCSLPQKSIPQMSSGFRFVLFLSLLNGGLYLISMIMNQVNVERNGAILQSTFARLGVLIPTILSIVIFGERPNILQIVGIVLVVLAIFNISGLNKKNLAISENSPNIFLLLLCLAFGGAADFMSKVFQQFGTRDMDSWFILLTFFFAMIFCFVIVIAKREKITVREILLGIALGVPNFLSSRFLLKALSSVSAYIAYPTYSVGAILFVIVISSICFKEKLNKQSKFGIVLIIAAIVLLNIN